jgi:CRISPR-associated protein Csm4
VLLFPRPQVRLGRAKALKKVGFLSEGALRLLARGASPDPERELIQGGSVWVAPEERDAIAALLLEHEQHPRRRERLEAQFKEDPKRIRLWSGKGAPPAPHVAVDRVSSASNLFFAGRLQFAPECGLYFWVDFTDAEYRSHLEAALAFLQDEGIGGRRSTGHGQFTFAAEEHAFPVIEGADAWVTLSLYHPRREEVEQGVLRNARYRRIYRHGWIYSPDGRNLRRKGLWMLSEGAVLPREVLGTMEDLRPEIGFAHPVWRYGYALTMPMRLEGQL